MIFSIIEIIKNLEIKDEIMEINEFEDKKSVFKLIQDIQLTTEGTLTAEMRLGQLMLVEQLVLENTDKDFSEFDFITRAIDNCRAEVNTASFNKKS